MLILTVQKLLKLADAINSELKADPHSLKHLYSKKLLFFNYLSYSQWADYIDPQYVLYCKKLPFFQLV